MIEVGLTGHRFRAALLSGLMLVSGGVVTSVGAAEVGAEEASPAPRSEASTASPVPGSSAPIPSASPAPAVASRDLSSIAIRTELVTDGLSTPVYLTGDGTGSQCLYIVERGGRVRILQNGELLERPFLDISSIVLEGAEQGLHSIAFHPEFARNRRVFLHFNDGNGSTRVSEFRGRPCRPGGKRDNRQARSLINEVQPFPNNNAGWIGFGPDGYLYIPLGDGGGVSPGDPDGIGQSRSARLSKVLRLDVDRGRRANAIPRDNPFVKKRQGYPRETWAMGLRDPRRASFDPATGDLWIGDMGQDRFEEIDRIPAGEAALNFGWSDMEGDECHNLPGCDPSAYELPVHTYDQVAPHCGVVGGYVYRGKEIPELEGVYLFSDFCSGFIWGIDAEAVAAGAPAAAQLLLDAPQGFVSFGRDDAGELYVVALEGSVYRIEGQETS